MPPDTRAKHDTHIVANHVGHVHVHVHPLLSKWRRARIRDQSKAKPKYKISEIVHPVEELVPLRSILRNSEVSRDAYYHNLSEVEFDAKVLENTQENKINKPTIRNILKKHDNLKTILKQAQPPDKQEISASKKPNTPSPNNLGFAEIVCELKKLQQETEVEAGDNNDGKVKEPNQTNLLKTKDSLELEENDESKSEEVGYLLTNGYCFIVNGILIAKCYFYL